MAGLLAVPAGVLSKLRAHGLARVQIGKGGVAYFPGYEGAATHEVGHALGDIFDFDNAGVLRAEYLAQASGLLSKRSEYYPKGLPSETGRKEFFAESVALGIMDPEKLKRYFTKAYSNFILRIVLA